MISKKVDLKKSDETGNKDRYAQLEEQDEFVNGCYYAPWDI